MPDKKKLKLTKFLQQLCDDPTLLKRFKKDPDKVMESQDLSAAHRRVLRSKDHKKVNRAVLAEHRQAGIKDIVCVVTCIEMGSGR